MLLKMTKGPIKVLARVNPSALGRAKRQGGYNYGGSSRSSYSDLGVDSFHSGGGGCCGCGVSAQGPPVRYLPINYFIYLF